MLVACFLCEIEEQSQGDFPVDAVFRADAGQSNACISLSGYESGDIECCYYSVRATAIDK